MSLKKSLVSAGEGLLNQALGVSVLKVKEGQKAPAFKLKNQDGEAVSLKDYSGKKVVLFFYPKDMTPGCTIEACDFNENLSRIKRKKAVVLGVSFDDETRHQKFIDKHGLKYDLLVDDAKKIADKYGVYQKKKFMGKEFMGIVRSTFVIDEDGKIKKIFSPVKVKGHVDAVMAEL
jgi:thioredoxin-dependent peroxiredoxin